MKLTRTKEADTEYIAVSSQNKKFKIINPFSENIKINSKKVDIKIFDDENGFTYLLFKRKKFLVEIVEKSQNKYTVLINGVSYSFSIETPISYKRKKYLDKNKSQSKLELVGAPMPGKIVDILVETGAKVKEGEAILILEAMKMQNEIIAPVSGTIKKIFVNKEDIVNKEDVLMEIEK
jgi:propionyl-CoA carboxylase alpha chain